eukprot:6339298-Prorocentrum_lima.AAC.1
MAEFVSQCNELGYEVLLNAAHYGLPQRRQRWYLAGYRKAPRKIPNQNHSKEALPHWVDECKDLSKCKP